jgi:hypothetical protein
MDGISNIAHILIEYPQLEDKIIEAYSTMIKSIENGESKIEEQDLFYWYIHKLKRGEQPSSL